MSVDLNPLVQLYKEATQGQRQAKQRVAELVMETGKHQQEEQRHANTLKLLMPLLHSLEGGSEAMKRTREELAKEEQALQPTPPPAIEADKAMPLPASKTSPATWTADKPAGVPADTAPPADVLTGSGGSGGKRKG